MHIVVEISGRMLAILLLALSAGVACAQSDNPWSGPYMGLGAGAARTNSCSSWTPSGAAVEPPDIAAFYHRNCSGGGLVGGVQIGDNFQYRRLLWGMGADLDIWSGRNRIQSLTYAGAAPPPGTYAFSGKMTPSGFGIVGPRIGYAGNQWLPYLRAGAIVAIGSRNGMLGYTPTGATKPTTSFSGGESFSSTGWVAGGGAEWGLNGPWSITAEYLHATLGNGSNGAAKCKSAAAACAPFSGISFDNLHNGVSANMFRVGINYWFRYW